MKLKIQPKKNVVRAVCWKIIRRLMSSNYYSSRAYYKYQLNRKGQQYKDPPLLIYQMGKVGSKTVADSLNASSLNMPIFHVHHLTSDAIARLEERSKKYFYVTERPAYVNICTSWTLQYLRTQITKGLKGNEKWKVITLVRDPIAVNVSQFFHHFEKSEFSNFRYKIKSYYHDFEIEVDPKNIDALAKIFLEKVSHDRPLTFLDNELKNVFGINVFTSEFPKSKGYKIFEGESADLLLIKLESLNHCASDAFKEFFNIEEFTLVNSNVGSEKQYNAIYQIFKNSAFLPDSYIDEMYRSKYMQHFYSEQEIERFREKWRMPVSVTVGANSEREKQG